MAQTAEDDLVRRFMQQANGGLSEGGAFPIGVTAANAPEPLYGEPGEITDEQVNALWQRSRKQSSDPRKRMQAMRDRILRSKHRGDIDAYIRTLHKPEFARKICPHINVADNPFQDIVRDVVALYRGGAVRRIDGVSEDEQAAFDELVTETQIATKAQGWAERAYAVGAQFTIPTMRRQRIRFQAPTPETVDLVLDVDDPTGDPVAVSYPSRRGMIVVDAVAQRYFEPVGDRIVEIEELRVEHGVRELPASALRFTDPPEDDDWWDADMHERLRQGALLVGYIGADLGLVRKGQRGKLLTMSGPLHNVPRGQMLGDPTGSLVLPTDGQSVEDPRENKVDVYEYATDPAMHLLHKRSAKEAMAESTGVRATVNTDGQGKWDFEWDFDGLAELRIKLMLWALLWERQTWTFTVAFARAQRHPLARRLPTPEKVSAGFYLSLPPLHRKFADPLKELEYLDKLLSKAQISIIDYLRRVHGHMPEEALWRMLQRNMAINSTYYDEVAKRVRAGHMSVDGTIETAAQAFGSMGPAVRDGRALPPGGEGVPNNDSPSGS